MMKIEDYLILVIIVIIIYILYINNKKNKYYNNKNSNNNNDDNNKNRIYYRNSHSMYRDDIYNNEYKNDRYKNQRININNYKIKQELLKEFEFKFYNTLKSSINKDYIICPKVKISNFIELNDKRSWEDYYNKISNHSIDFIVCNNIFKPLFGIILSYGNLQIQTESEKFIDELFNTINLPILKIEISNNYQTDIIKKQIEDLLNTIKNKKDC